MKHRAALRAGGLAMAALLVLAGSAASAQVKSGAEQGLGLTGADIPPLLVSVQAQPYQLPTPLDCATVAGELAALGDLLGGDVDAEPAAADSKADIKSKGASLVRGLVPYGGVVRFVTGASAKDKALQKAVLAGYARRGFLRGLQATPGCGAAPEPPPAAAPKSRRQKAGR